MNNLNQQRSPESNRAEKIFIGAIEFETEDQRSAYLDNACAGDSAIRREVDRLFELSSSAKGLFDELTNYCIPTQDFIDIIDKNLADLDRANPLPPQR